MIAVLAASFVLGWLAPAGVVYVSYHACGSPLSARRAVGAWPVYALVLAVVVVQVMQSVFAERGVGL